MSTRNERKGGFTLIELLVGTMLLSIVMTAVYTLFFSVIQSWRSVEYDQGFHRKARNTLTLIRQDYDKQYAPAGHLMSGSAHEVTFYIIASPKRLEDVAGPRLLRIVYRFDARNGELSREEAVVEMPLPEAPTEAGAFERRGVTVTDEDAIVVARGLAEVEFRYLWMPQPDGTYWRNAPTPIAPLIASRHEPRWGLPQALEVRLHYAAGESAPPYDATLRLPTRATNQRREAYQLRNVLGDAL